MNDVRHKNRFSMREIHPAKLLEVTPSFNILTHKIARVSEIVFIGLMDLFIYLLSFLISQSDIVD